jgi:hypothetical protein
VNYFTGDMRDALQNEVVRLLLFRKNWLIVFHDMERDLLGILSGWADKVWKGSFA